MKRLFLAAAMAGVLSACSDTDPVVSDAGSADEPILEALENQGITIHSPMAVPGGLDAFAGSVGPQPVAVYLLPDPDYALIGTLVDSEGRPVAEEELRRLVSGPLDAQTWEALESARWVGDGNADAERIIYAFTDANCPFCNEMWHSSRPWVEAGKVQIRHLMVGIIRADSPAKAAAILEADAPQAALAYNEANHERGGIDPLATIAPQTSAQLEANLRLMSDLGFGGNAGRRRQGRRWLADPAERRAARRCPRAFVRPALRCPCSLSAPINRVRPCPQNRSTVCSSLCC